MFERLKAFFDEKGWVYTPINEQTVILLGVSGKNGKFQCVADVREEKNQFLFYSICGVNTPEEKRSAMSEFLMRANVNKVLGNFEMNFDDGEVKYKTSIDYEGIEFTSKLIENLIMINLMMMDSFLPAILKLVSSDITPLQVLNTIEQ